MSRGDELKPGTDGPSNIPDHEMVRVIGRGSYGEVWLARNAVGTWRAVKVVYRDRFPDPRPYEREFIGIQKYEPISRTNEGLVDVLQIGRNEAEGYFYYVMELADDAGEAGGKVGKWESGQQVAACLPTLVRSRPPTLSAANYIPRTLSLDLIRRGRLSLEECVTLGLKLNLALGYLHRNGLIHRDVKPPNIIFVNGVPKLADIGLVTGLSGAHSYVGTEGYTAPEGPNSPQADLYALGKLLYEASMGKDRHEFPSPFTGLGTDPDAKGLAELNAIVLRACAPDRKQRYQTAEEMNADLALVHSGKSVRQKHAVERRLKVTRRVAAAALAVIVLGVFPYYLAIREARSARIAARQEAWQRQVAQASEKRAEQAKAGEARARLTAEQRLYDSLLGEARATHLARRVGYRDKVFSLLKQANALDVPQKNLADLSREAGACLGDFVGLTPTLFTDFPANVAIRRALLDPAGRSVAFLLRNETVLLRQLPSGTEIARFELTGDLPTRSVCFNDTGDQLVFVRMPAEGRLEDRIAAARLNIWTREADNHWRESEETPLPGALDCLRSTRGVFVTAFSHDPRLGKLIDVRTKAVVQQFEFPEEWIPEVTLSPDGQLLVAETTESGDPADSVLTIWDLRNGQRRTSVAPQLGVLGNLGFSPDGKYLMCASRSSGHIYEVGGFQRVAEFSPHARVPLVFAPGSGLAALPSSAENRIRFWDWISDEEYAVLDEPQPAHSTAFAPDGSFFLTASLHQARVYRLDLTPEKLSLPRQPGNRPGVAFSPEGLRIATVGLSPAVRVCDAPTGREIWKSDALPTQGHAPVFSPDGRWLATGDFVARRVVVWDAYTGERLWEVATKAGGRLWSVQFSPDGRYLATASGISRTHDNGIELWEIDRRQAGEFAESFRARPVKSVGGSAWSLVFAPDGRSLAFVDRDRSAVYAWEFGGQAAPRCLGTNLIHGIGNDQGLGFTPDSRRILMIDSTRAIVTLDVATGEKVSSFPTVDPRRTPEWTESASICLSPDGTKLAMVSASGRGVDVWCPLTGQLLFSLPELDVTVYWQAWSPDSLRLAISRSNGDIAVWNFEEIAQVLAKLELNP